MYVGAKYILKEKILVGKTGETLNEGDICKTMSEREAKAREDFEPVYEGKQEPKKKFKSEEF